MQDCGWQGELSANNDAADYTKQMPWKLENKYYFKGKLREYIGEVVKVEYTMGTAGLLFDVIGKLVEVGENYLVLKNYLTDEDLVLDNMSVKFVTVY